MYIIYIYCVLFIIFVSFVWNSMLNKDVRLFLIFDCDIDKDISNYT